MQEFVGRLQLLQSSRADNRFHSIDYALTLSWSNERTPSTTYHMYIVFVRVTRYRIDKKYCFFSLKKTLQHLLGPEGVCCLLRLRADDPNARAKGFHGCRHPADQPTAPDGYNDSVKSCAPR